VKTKNYFWNVKRDVKAKKKIRQCVEHVCSGKVCLRCNINEKQTWQGEDRKMGRFQHSFTYAFEKLFIGKWHMK
jgi:hypothetical protein